ncbi:hypothetical protein PIB30_098339 [Stylosanthes scabra]|uniref:Putative plant transposon protein domain-containing protein n=1 Tax=Stylosanthes scabra TaxID=79078 RepID=A0ABU6XVT0_9FABA|nr:hypothetical protein [Stylosanthes scabra]
MASSSSVSVFDNYRFKSAFNEELYNSIVKNKKVIAECCIDLDKDEYPEVKEQIALRGWRRLAAPKQEISIDLIHELYANAILTEEEMEEAGGHTFRSYVRATDFETRKEHDQQLDQVLADLCIPGATWKLRTGQLRVPIQLRRSEIPVIRAILIHCIMRGEDVRAEDIIADKIVRMAQRIKERGKLGFPSTIFKLCKEAGRRQQENEDEDEPMPQVEEGNEGQAHDYDYHHQPEYEHHQLDYEQPQPEFEHHQEFNKPPVQPPPYHVPTYTDQHQKDLGSIETQLQNMMWYQQQALENMSKNQAEYMAELRDIKGKQQELYENNNRFYNQVRQEQKEMVQEIQQIKNYQVNQTLVDSTRHKAYMDELAAIKAKQDEFFSNQANQYNLIRQDHKLLGKEILDVKNGSGSSTQPPPPPPYEPDQALMKIREQHATFTEICRQLKDWTRNTSGRESYMVWAHQLANPNLVELSSQKIVKQIYDNIDRKRPMFRGLLKSDLQPSDPTQPPSSSKDRKDPPSSSKDQKDPQK